MTQVATTSCVRSGRVAPPVVPGGPDLSEVDSPFGIIWATGLMSAAKATKGRTVVPWTESPALLAARSASSERSRAASLAIKRVLDAIEGGVGRPKDWTTPGL